MATFTRVPHCLNTLQTRNGSTIRYYLHSITAHDRQVPTLCFIPGFRSFAFQSLKSEFLLSLSRKQGYSFLTWDHASQGESIAAAASTASVKLWYEDSLDILNQIPRGKLLLVGASMGAWVSLLVARRGPSAIKDRLLGVVGIGAGINFTEDWLNNEVPVKDPSYVWKRPTQYHASGHYDIPVKMLLDSRECLMLDDEISVSCPVTFVHGRKDTDSKIDSILSFAKKIPTASVQIIDDGDHRLSKDSELACIEKTIIQLVEGE
ncbi:Alpha/Beta hydrolase protein [Umbelopsis sp. PMI_123]|jgi:pimeloyl-ACP methyl ester carboxylesterase|nr:Alpha/Beta hydrolase protein [Umbelopsis sp. PMI_123]